MSEKRVTVALTPREMWLLVDALRVVRSDHMEYLVKADKKDMAVCLTNVFEGLCMAFDHIAQEQAQAAVITGEAERREGG